MVMKKSAALSECMRYRYRLLREWDGRKETAMFVMLNPSRADANVDDNTIRRCIRFAQEWGYGALLVGNLFALRSPHPRDLLSAADPVGPDNDQALREMAESVALIVAAWGADGALLGRDQAVLEMFRGRWHALGETKAGLPRHPLYLPARAQPYPFY